MRTLFVLRRASPRPCSSLTRAFRRYPPILSVLSLLLILPGPNLLASGHIAATRKQDAASQFEKAEQMRESLNGRPAADRTRRDYQRVADAYRRVYYVAPDSSKADASVVAVAEILAAMGRQFEPGEKDLRSAIRQYEFLRHEYPGSKYRFQALFTIGQIYKEDLGDEEAARATFEEFVRRYPRQALATEARRALAELNQPAAAAKKPVEQVAPPSTPALPQPVAQQKRSHLPMVTGIRHWSTPDYTRLAIDVEGEVKYEAGRVPNPDRIFFDLPDTKLASVLVGKSFDVQDGFLKKIRVAQYQPGATRVVLEVADVSNYSAFLLPNPYRLIIDIHGGQPRSQTLTAMDVGTSDKKKQSRSQHPEASNSGASGKGTAEEDSDTAETLTHPPTVSKLPHRRVVVDENGNRTVSDLSASENARSTESNGVPASAKNSPSRLEADAPSTSKSRTPPDSSSSGRRPNNSPDPLFANPGDSSGPELKATNKPTTAPTAVAVAPRAKDHKKPPKGSVATVTSTHEAEPASDGQRSLTRALGLKIGRIVIDAGHGGHDTGTIGPTGLLEKDLVLDVSLRLGRLLETRLGADVLYTRDDDTFIPLETRTAIANEHQADLFISVHANSSDDPAARGVETYYLNFTSNPDALEVAARENALSEKSIFELQDLVKKITLKEKIEESHELATDVQQSLYAGLAPRHSAVRDRGVKKAPFVVLIGANMPSILAEISFLSNPTDESKLETPEYREKIAESLYKGIAKYADGLSGVKVASKLSKSTTE
jgi:N-acetylmuramoyl-L-alanine amidase